MRWTVCVAVALTMWGCGGSNEEAGAEKGLPGVDGIAKPELGGEAGTSMKALGPVDLMDPTTAVLVAPDQFQVAVETTKGPIVIQLQRDWAPNGVDRFYCVIYSSCWVCGRAIAFCASVIVALPERLRYKSSFTQL